MKRAFFVGSLAFCGVVVVVACGGETDDSMPPPVGSGGAEAGGMGGGTGTRGGSGGSIAGGGTGNTVGAAGDAGSGGSTAGDTGSGGSTGGETGAGGVAEPICEMVSEEGWVGQDPDETGDNPDGVQGAWYGYGDDGTSCADQRVRGNPCGPQGCCLSGATVVDATYTAWGCGLGVELNSTGGDNPTKQAYSGAATGFRIAFTGSSGGIPLRVNFTQAADTTGLVSPYRQIPPVSGPVEYTVMFTEASYPAWCATNPACQGLEGQSASSSSSYDMQIQVPGGDTAAAYDFCITSITPVGGDCESGTGGTGGTGGTLSLGSTCDEFGVLTSSTGQYRIQNNVWGANTPQCIDASEDSGSVAFTVTDSGHNSTTGEPAAYPSIVYGWHWGDWTQNSGLPAQVSSLVSVPSQWSVNASASGRYNVAYDLWLMPTSNPSTPDGGLEIMIWIRNNGAWPFGANLGTVSLEGAQWDLYYGDIGGWDYAAFVRTSNTSSVDFDLKSFIDEVVSRGWATNSWYLLSVQAGFEIWQGGQGLETTSFSVDVN